MFFYNNLPIFYFFKKILFSSLGSMNVEVGNMYKITQPKYAYNEDSLYIPSVAAKYKSMTLAK